MSGLGSALSGSLVRGASRLGGVREDVRPRVSGTPPGGFSPPRAQHGQGTVCGPVSRLWAAPLR